MTKTNRVSSFARTTLVELEEDEDEDEHADADSTSRTRATKKYTIAKSNAYFN